MEIDEENRDSGDEKSANNYVPASKQPTHSDDDEEPRKARVERVEVETDGPPTTYAQLGTDLPISPDSTTIHFQCARIKKLENLEHCTKLRKLELIANCVEKLENLEANTELEHLELYQNLLKKIENIEHLHQLRVLDLSFNKIRKINCLHNFVHLEKLYLSANKIIEVQGLDALCNLKLLELGANRIRVVTNIAHMTQLEELWLGKNKIVSMELPPLPRLKRVSFQNNRLEEWHPSLFSNCPNITHLYLGHNKLPDFPTYFQNLKQLEELDMASNALQTLPRMDLPALKEYWLNYNNISSLDQVRTLDCFPQLETVYLEHNPIWKPPPHDDLYKNAILTVVPYLKQLDSFHLQAAGSIVWKESEQKIRGIRKK